MGLENRGLEKDQRMCGLTNRGEECGSYLSAVANH